MNLIKNNLEEQEEAIVKINLTTPSRNAICESISDLILPRSGEDEKEEGGDYVTLIPIIKVASAFHEFGFQARSTLKC